MMQYFEWYLPNDGTLWNKLKEDAPHLKEIGISAVWIPPCYKGQNSDDVGYGAYDLYDLGEFEQKGTIRTKYGTKEELIAAIEALHEHEIQVYADMVINHKAGADAKEVFSVVKVNPENRDEVISEPLDIEGWTSFTFPGRGDKYSDFKWHHQHFTAVDFDESTGESGIFKILGDAKDFSEHVTDEEKGNFDYLMHADLDFNNPEVIAEIKKWAVWFVEELNLDGLRIDALKHIDLKFMNHLTEYLHNETSRDLFYVAEYWTGNIKSLNEVLQDSFPGITLFDVPLHYNFYDAAQAGKEYDLSKIFEDTIVQDDAIRTMTFVDNHDSQIGQSLESWVDDWFKPLAYAMILLRQKGYPCVFYADYYGGQGEQSTKSHQELLDILLMARRKYAWGEEILHLDHSNCIAIQRLGSKEHQDSGLVCILSNGDNNYKEITFNEESAGQVYFDLTGHIKGNIMLDETGTATFPCPAGSFSVWVKKKM
ncbi:MAG: alpha-amylase [Clostridiaceae bacterium]|nr:alpha-amylase [Clostridiaceae bacterium]